MSQTPHRWDPYHPDWSSEPAGGKQPVANPTVTEGARADRVLLGPSGEVLVRIVDRPFLGFQR